MGLFGFFKKKDKKEQEVFSDDSNMESYKMVIELFESISTKCMYGDEIEALNQYERVIYVTQDLEMEVNNGGFSQYFFNSSGNFSGEVVAAFTEISALKTAKICKKALSVYGGKLPADRDEREELLDELESDKIDKLLDKCDDAFFEYAENLNQLYYEYIMRHKEYFE